MLLSVLHSPRDIAISVEINIETMRVFVQARSMAAAHQNLAKQLTELQDKTEVLPASGCWSA